MLDRIPCFVMNTQDRPATLSVRIINRACESHIVVKQQSELSWSIGFADQLWRQPLRLRLSIITANKSEAPVAIVMKFKPFD